MSACGKCGGQAGKNVLIFSCSGAANVGEIADRVARRLMREGAGGMFCLAGVSALIPSMVETTKKADVSLVLDGCPLDCARKAFENAGITNARIIRLTDLGIAKAKGVPVTEEQAELVYQRAKEMLATV